MKQLFQSVCLSLAVLAISAPHVFAQGETPTYTNAVVLSVDAQRRIVVLRTPGGVKQSLMLDDLLAGTGSIKAGDRVVVTLLGGPGRRRISAITLAAPQLTVAQSSAPLRTAATPTPRPGRSAAERAEARARYTDQVAALSRQAQTVDAAWNNFVTACAVKPVSNEGGGRDWFGLWDGRVYADYSGGECRELFNQIVAAGEGIKKAMAAAEGGIEEYLTPGEVRDIRKSHSMNWDGWLLAPPQRKEP